MYKKNDDLFADITETQTIFVDMENGIFYVLPVFANIVFQLLISGKSIENIKKDFSAIPSIPSDYEQRIDYVFNALKEFHIIVEGQSGDTSMLQELNKHVITHLQESDFVYKITPSNDVQELLLDDPIHDVSLEGWQPFAK